MNSQDGREMDRPAPGSVKRARERAVAGLPRDAIPPGEPQIARPSGPRQPATGPTIGLPRTGRPQAPFALQTKDGQIGVPISRPTPAPQWPLQEPIITPAQVAGEPFRPPAGASQPPQRPPRPSRVPSILDASKVQDHTPVFQYRPRSERESAGQELVPVPETPSSVSRPSTLSSIASIPDFPLPLQAPSGPPRRSVNLGPPPSARRGASSFYSNASYVSPIPEESPHARSRSSYASSAAMPDNWASPSPGPSPDFPDPLYGEAATEDGGYSAYGDDDTEERRLVRSASIGKRAKPTLVSATPARAVNGADRGQGPAPQPTQLAFKNGTGYVEHSSSSGTIPAGAMPPIGSAMTANTILNAYSSASADDPSSPSQRTTPSPQLPVGGGAYTRPSAIRRPLRLDIDAVRKAEARGSLTSLPDLIRRATRLAANLEKGRRPASRFDDLDDFPDFGVDMEKYRSGLSDMLAAFPPPAHPATAPSRRSVRESIREQMQSWPLPLNFSRTTNTPQDAVTPSDDQRSDRKHRRRCCGLPLWVFVLVIVLVLILITAAVVIPVQLLVVRNRNGESQAQQEIQKCRQQLVCANGGINVVNQGVCSCNCAASFTGADCTAVDDTACATIALTGPSTNNNATFGNAIPRLIQQAQTNFSIPLSAPSILAKLNAENLSCSAENALVTFEGRATRQGVQVPRFPDSVNAAVVNGVLFTTITIVVAPFTTFTLNPAWPTALPGGDGQGTRFTTRITSGAFATTLTVSRSSPPATTRSATATATSMVTTTMTMPSGTGTGGIPIPTGGTGSTFAITEDVLDFARVAVLYILQEGSLANAEAAQIALQKFFGGSRPTIGGDGVDISLEAARNVTVGGTRSVDLVGFVVDLGGGSGRVGGKGTVSKREWAYAAAEAAAGEKMEGSRRRRRTVGLV